MTRQRTRWPLILAAAAGLCALLPLVMFSALFVALSGSGTSGGGCEAVPAAATVATPAPGVAVAAAPGSVVGATEYGGPGDPSSGTVGSSGVDLDAHPDSYAELGGTSFATATAMGGLAYGTPLRITNPQAPERSVVAEKQDIGLGGGPIDGHPRVIDLWWQLAGALGLPYEDGLWSGTVQISRPPATGSAAVLGATPADAAAAAGGAGAGAQTPDPVSAAGCASSTAGGQAVAVTAGPRAQLSPDGQALAPADAPAAVKGIIAAGNQIVGKPYVYGGGHGLALSLIAPSYDCSSSVSHLLWGGGLLSAGEDMTSGELEDWGLPGPGRWVTIDASADHVFMYVAGLRWDTHNAAGPGDGSTGIGWHPLVREDDGFVVRHPRGL